MGPWFQALKMHSFCTVWLLDAGAGAQGDGAYIGTFQGYYAYAQSRPLSRLALEPSPVLEAVSL